MPRYFQNKAEQLHAESLASFLIIEAKCANSVTNGIISDKLCKIYQNAQARCSRRFYLAFGGK